MRWVGASRLVSPSLTGSSPPGSHHLPPKNLSVEMLGIEPGAVQTLNTWSTVQLQLFREMPLKQLVKAVQCHFVVSS